MDHANKNQQIKNLITGLDSYTKTLNDKIKVNRILNDVDKRVIQEFKALLKISQNKYKSIKSGNSLQPALRHKAKAMENLIERIGDDPVFYRNDYLEEKMKIQNKHLLKVSVNINNNLKSIREEIRGKSELNGLTHEKDEDLQERQAINQNNNSKKKIGHAPNGVFASKSHNQIIADIIQNDENTFITCYNDYSSSLKSLKRSLSNSKPVKESPEKSGHENSIKDQLIWKFKQDSNSILNYKSTNKSVAKEDKSSFEHMNINKLINSSIKIPVPVAKSKLRSRSSSLEDGANETKHNGMMGQQDLNRHHTHISEENKLDDYSYSRSKHERGRESMKLIQALMKIKEGEIRENLGNSTISAVRNQILNSFDYNTQLGNLKKAIDQITSPSGEILRPDEIEKRVARRNITNQNKLLAHKKMTSQTSDSAGHGLNEYANSLEKEKKKENKLFVLKSNNQHRMNQIYVDFYSLNDNLVNSKLIEFNKILGKRQYDKKQFMRKLNEFTDEVGREIRAYKKSPPPLPRRFHHFNFDKTMSSIKVNEDKKNGKKKWNNFDNLIPYAEETDFKFGSVDNKYLVRKLVEEDWTKTLLRETEKLQIEDFNRFEHQVMQKEASKKLTEMNQRGIVPARLNPAESLESAKFYSGLLEKSDDKLPAVILPELATKNDKQERSDTEHISGIVFVKPTVPQTSEAQSERIQNSKSRLEQLLLKSPSDITEELERTKAIKSRISFCSYKPNIGESNYSLIFTSKRKKEKQS